MNKSASTFMMATLVDWKYPEVFEKTWKKINRIYKKRLDSKKTKKSRINTFVVTEAELMKVPDQKHRIEIETQVKAVLKEYAETINSLNKKEIRSQYSTHQIYKKDLDKMSKTKEFYKFLENKQNFTNAVEAKIEETGDKGSVLIWDSVENQDNRIILHECIASFTQNGSKKETLTHYIDELLIANFTRRFLPISHTLIVDLQHQYENLFQFLDTAKLGTSIGHSLELSLRTFIGVVSSVQETLKLFYREVYQSYQVGTSAFNYLQGLNSDKLSTWAQINNPDLGNQILHHINDLQNIIADIKLKLRTILRRKIPMNEDQTSQLINLITETDTKSNGFLLWARRFHQIPSFTMLDEGIAYEEVEDETYEPQSNTSIIEATKIFKTFSRGGSTIYALRGIDLQIEPGEFVIIRGPSGAGKTTLLQILAGLDDPQRGAVFFNNKNIVEMKDRHKTIIRRENYSFIFQSYALIPHLTAYENTKLPIELSGWSKELSNSIEEILKDVGIGQFSDHKPALLSGGQMQRLGIARSLVKNPKILFADEPTGDLDEKTGRQVMQLLKKYHEEMNVTIILVTHDEKVAQYGTREILISDGKIVNLELQN